MVGSQSRNETRFRLLTEGNRSHGVHRHNDRGRRRFPEFIDASHKSSGSACAYEEKVHFGKLFENGCRRTGRMHIGVGGIGVLIDPYQLWFFLQLLFNKIDPAAQQTAIGVPAVDANHVGSQARHDPDYLVGCVGIDNTGESVSTSGAHGGKAYS